MPRNITDEFTILVLTFIPSFITTEGSGDGFDLPVGNALKTANGGDRVAFDFLYKTGYPPATAFSQQWSSDAARITPMTVGIPYSPLFTPATPATSGEANADVYQLGHFQVNAPNVAPEPGVDFKFYYGRITIHQVDFIRETGMVV